MRVCSGGLTVGRGERGAGRVSVGRGVGFFPGRQLVMMGLLVVFGMCVLVAVHFTRSRVGALLSGRVIILSVPWSS